MKETLEQGTKLVQAVADTLFNVPSTEDLDGPIVSLPPTTTKLPREKPVCFLFFCVTIRASSLCFQITLACTNHDSSYLQVLLCIFVHDMV